MAPTPPVPRFCTTKSPTRIATVTGRTYGRSTGVATSMFWHSLLGIDLNGKPVTPCYTWADTRSAVAAVELREQLDPRAVHARTGCPLHSTFFPARLRWLRARSPETFKRVLTWGGFSDYLALRLFGRSVSSLSMASRSSWAVTATAGP
jgi:gluconokinase